MPETIKIDLGPYSIEDLEDAAQVFEVDPKFREDSKHTSGLDAYFAGMARALREEAARRAVGVTGVPHLVDVDFSAADETSIKGAMSRIWWRWQGEPDGSGVRKLLVIAIRDLFIELIDRDPGVVSIPFGELIGLDEDPEAPHA